MAGSLLILLFVLVLSDAERDEVFDGLDGLDGVVQQFVCKCGLDQRFLPFLGWSVAESPEGEEVASLHWN